jgi:membrane fusion protein, multidrug efflux system
MGDTITTTEGRGAKAAKAVEAKDRGAEGAGGKEAAKVKGAGAAEAGKKARRGPKVFGSLILIIIIAIGLVVGLRALQDTVNFVATDDAAIDGDRVNVSAKTLGRIAKLLAAEGDKVTAGQTLVLLDEMDLRAQEASASASLNFAKRNLELAKINLDRAQADSERTSSLLASGAATKESAEHSASALDAANAQYAIAQAQIDTATAQLGVIAASLLNARLSAPISGVVAKKSMMQGDVVQPGQAIYSVNNLDSVWVTANFEETKIGRIELGAPVDVTVDAFNGRVFSGKVVLIGAGIVAPAFSIGDFTKTTQRVPVRISVDKGGAALIPGMSVEVKVRTKALFKLPFGLSSLLGI